MTPCAYCIGCIYYRPKDKIWCCHVDAEKCERREYYDTGVDDDKQRSG